MTWLSSVTSNVPALSRRWAWLAGLGAVGLVIAMVWLHLDGRQRFEHALHAVQEVAAAQEDLARGALHLALGSDTESPWQRSTGLALLDAALVGFSSAAAELERHDDVATALQGDLQHVRSLLQAQRSAGTAAAANGPDPALRIALHRLGTSADAAKAALGSQLAALEQRLERRVLWFAGLAVLLLVLVCGLLYRVERERNAAQRRGRADEGLFRDVIEQTGAGIIMVSDGRVAYINPRGAQIVQCDAASLVGTDAVEMVVPPDRARLMAAMARHIADPARTPRPARYTLVDAQAPGRPVEIQASRALVDGKSVLIGVFRDIGAQLRLEAELALQRHDMEARVLERTAALQQALTAQSDADALLQAIADQQPTLIAWWDGARRLRFANRAYLDWFGFSAAQALGRTMFELFDIDATPDRYQAAMRASAGEAVNSGEEIVGSNGRRAHFWACRVPQRSSAQAGGYYYFATDISEVKRATQDLALANDALRQAEAFTRLVADNIPGRVSYWDHDHRCRFVNRVFCEWYAIAADDILGRTGEESGAFDRDVVQTDGPQRQAVLAGQAQLVERERRGADGRVVTTLVHFVPHLHDGAVLGYVVLATDITPVKQAQARLLELNDELARERDRAEAAATAKSAFLSNMSHEIRTPMNAIVGLTRLLQREIRELAPRAHLDRIGDAAQHLLALVNDILDLSKIDADRMTLEQIDFVPEDMLARTLSLIAERARDQGLELALDAGPLPPLVRGDPTRLAQALLNLLSNAVKFTDQGSVTLKAAVLAPTPTGWRLRFEVLDTGAGIADDALERMFGAFEQADASTTRRHGGTGLGLAITRRLARLMDGDVGARSQPGVGSCFWLEVGVHSPDGGCTPQHPVATTGLASLSTAEEALATLHRGRRLLLAEDNEVNQFVACAVLRHAGLTVDVAGDGQQALQMAQQNDYDLILLDVQMPVMDGLQAARALRALPGRPRVPILAMTAGAFAEDRQACLAAGMDGHVSKPVEPELLYRTLLHWLPPRQSASN